MNISYYSKSSSQHPKKNTKIVNKSVATVRKYLTSSNFKVTKNMLLNLSTFLKNNNTNSHYSTIPISVCGFPIMSRKKPKASTKIIFGDIYTMNLQGKSYFKSNTNIAKELGLSVYTVKRSIKYLKQHHWIKVMYTKPPRHSLYRTLLVDIAYFSRFKSSVENHPTKRYSSGENQPTLVEKQPVSVEKLPTPRRKATGNISVESESGNRSRNKSDSVSDAKNINLNQKLSSQNLKPNQNPIYNPTDSTTQSNESTHTVRSSQKEKEPKGKSRSTSSLSQRDFPSTKLSQRLYKAVQHYFNLTGRDVHYTQKCTRQWGYFLSNGLISYNDLRSIFECCVQDYVHHKFDGSSRSIINYLGYNINDTVHKNRDVVEIQQYNKKQLQAHEQHTRTRLQQMYRFNVKYYKDLSNIKSQHDLDLYRKKYNKMPFSKLDTQNILNNIFPKLKIQKSPLAIAVGMNISDFNVNHLYKYCLKHKYFGNEALQKLLKIMHQIDNKQSAYSILRLN